jgi:hypothetical protein
MLIVDLKARRVNTDNEASTTIFIHAKKERGEGARKA